MFKEIHLKIEPVLFSRKKGYCSCDHELCGFRSTPQHPYYPCLNNDEICRNTVMYERPVCPVSTNLGKEWQLAETRNNVLGEIKMFSIREDRDILEEKSSRA